MKEEGAMVNPMLSSVFYASGARDDALRQVGQPTWGWRGR